MRLRVRVLIEKMAALAVSLAAIVALNWITHPQSAWSSDFTTSGSLAESFPARKVYDNGALVGGKGYIVTSGPAGEVAHVETSGMAVSDHNGAAIRQESDVLRVLDLWAHDGEQGILSGRNTRLEVRRSRFERLGANEGSGIAHAIYNSAAELLVEDSAFYWPQKQAHLVKTRGKHNVIRRAILAQLDGWGSRAIDFEEFGGDSLVEYAVLQLGPKADDNGAALIQWIGPQAQRLHLKHVIAICDHPSGTTALVNGYGTGEIVLEDVTVVGNCRWKGGSDLSALVVDKGGHPKVTVAGPLRYFPTRAGAGFPAYDSTEASIPWPRDWGPRPGLWDEGTVIPHTPPSLTVRAPAAVPAGGSATVSWQAEDALAIESSGALSGLLPTSGQLTVGPLSKPAEIELRAIGGRGTAGKAIRIDVIAARAVSLSKSKLAPYWTEIPDSALAKVFPSRDMVGSLWGNIGPRGVIDAWGGGVYAPERHELIIPAQGGHKDYFGNEAYHFSLDAREWKRFRDPSPVKSTTSSGEFLMADGPASRHSYDGLAWTGNKVFIGFGSVAPTGSQVGGNWLYDPADHSYEELPVGSLGRHVWFDGKLIWSQNGERLQAFDPATKKRVIDRGSRLGHSKYEFGSGAFDSATKTYVFFGQPGLVSLIDISNPNKPVERGYSLTQAASAALNATGWSGTYPVLPIPAPDDAAPTQAYGVAYHPPSRSFILWAGGPDVIRLDPKALRFERIATPPGHLVPPAGSVSGIFGRWAYVPHLDAFIGVNKADRNVFLYKLP